MPRRRLVLFALLAFVGLPACILAAGFVLGPPSYYTAKYAPASTGATPSPLPDPVIPEVQTEPHTCGLHSLRALYRAYSLDPDAHDLRFRLGTDKPVNNWLPDTKGTIHPDMLRVLRQDGFDTEILFPNASDTPTRLRDHLDAGHPAVILIDTGAMHWVVAPARERDDLMICDSLAPQPYSVDLESYLRDEVYSLLLVRPTD